MKKMGIFSRVSRFAQGAYDALTESVPAKAIGTAVSLPAQVIQAGVNTVGKPIAIGVSRAKGLSEQEAEAKFQAGKKKSMQMTREEARSIGKEGFAGAVTGGAGKIINTALATPSLVEGTKDIKAGKTAAGFGQIALGLLGIFGAAKGPTLRQSLSEVGTAASNIASGTKGAITKPFSGAKTRIAEGIASKEIPPGVKEIVSPTASGEKTLIDELDLDEQNALSSIAKSKPEPVPVKEYFDAARAAKDNPAKATPLELAGQKATETLKMMRDVLKSIGTKKQSSLQSAEGKMFQVDEKAIGDFETALQERFGAKIFRDQIMDAEGRVVSIADKSDQKLLMDFYRDLNLLKPKQKTGYAPAYIPSKTYSGVTKPAVVVGEAPQGPGYAPKGEAPRTIIGEEVPYEYTSKAMERVPEGRGLRQVDDMIDKYQAKLDYSQKGAVPVSTPVEGFLKEQLKRLNDNVKTQVGGDYAQLNSAYSGIKKMESWLNKNLGPDAIREGALMKRVFSPSDAGTKRYFAAIKDITGVDLIREAYLAKVAMEAVGDPRARTLLQDVGVIAESVPGLGFFADFSGKLGAVRRAINSAERALSSDKAVEAVLQKIADGAEILPEEITLLDNNPGIADYFQTLFGVAPSVALQPGTLMGIQAGIEENQQNKLEGDFKQDFQEAQQKAEQVQVDPELLREKLDELLRQKQANAPTAQ